ncbi:MAG: hypothetical protein ACOVN5_08575 [Aquidulcibacter sp.]
MTPTTDLQKLADLATLDVERLEKELDITNADHIALWLASSGQMSISYLAVQIANAYDRATAARVIELEAENKRLREGFSKIIQTASASVPEIKSPADQYEEGFSDAFDRAADIARAALKGGEI